MHKAVINIQTCGTTKGGLGFSIDGNFVEIRMDDIVKAVSKGWVNREDFSVIESMFPEPARDEKYVVTTRALICAESATSKKQSAHMDSSIPHLILQNAFYEFPLSQRLEDYQETVRATVFKDMRISNELDFETCDSSEVGKSCLRLGLKLYPKVYVLNLMGTKYTMDLDLKRLPLSICEQWPSRLTNSWGNRRSILQRKSIRSVSIFCTI